MKPINVDDLLQQLHTADAAFTLGVPVRQGGSVPYDGPGGIWETVHRIALDYVDATFGEKPTAIAIDEEIVRRLASVADDGAETILGARVVPLAGSPRYWVGFDLTPSLEASVRTEADLRERLAVLDKEIVFHRNAMHERRQEHGRIRAELFRRQTAGQIHTDFHAPAGGVSSVALITSDET